MIWAILYIVAAILAISCAVQFTVKVGVRKVSVSFGLGMIAIATLYLAIASLRISDLYSPGLSSWLFDFANSILPLTGAAGPFFLLVLSRNFGRGDDKSNSGGISTLTRLAGLMTVIVLYFVATGMVFETIYTANNYVMILKGFFAKAVGFVMGALLVLALLNFENTRRNSISHMRHQIFVFMIITMLFVAGIVRLFFLGQITLDFLEYASPISVICMGWLYYLQMGKDSYSANVVIDRQAFLSSAVVLFLGIFMVTTGIIAYVIKQIGGRPDVFLSIIGAFLVIALFIVVIISDSIRHRISNAMLSRIYAGRFDYKSEWRQLSEDFAACESVPQLYKLLMERIKRLFDPTRMMLLITEGNYLVCRYPVDCASTEIKRNDPIAEWIFLKSESSFFSDIEESAHSKLKEFEDNFAVLVPIIAEKKLIGLILLGAKSETSPYNNEDFAMLSAIAQQAAVTMLHLRSRDTLLESEKLASFHKTASFVVHDLKNAVSMLSLMMQNAPRKMSDPEFQKESIRTIDQAVARMQHIIEKLKKPPQKEQLQIYELNPLKVLESAIEKSGVKSKAGIEIELLNNDFQPVKTDQGVLETVLINFLINAVEAMPEGGKIIIKQNSIDNKPRLEISDTGVGMTREFIETRLFRPFETTKSKGLGVGLYQCREMFNQAGGEIIVKSEPGKGSTFILIFP